MTAKAMADEPVQSTVTYEELINLEKEFDDVDLEISTSFQNARARQ